MQHRGLIVFKRTVFSSGEPYVLSRQLLELRSNPPSGIRSLSGDDTVLSKDDLSKVVWNIKNKYYSASVHFRVIQLDEMHEMDVNGSPALIYTWDSNEVRYDLISGQQFFIPESM